MTVTDDPDHRYQGALDRLEKADIAESDKELIREFLDAIHPEISTVNYTNSRGERETKSYGTLAAYCQSLKRVCELTDKELPEYESVTEVNRLFERFQRGTHPNVKDDGYGKSTLGQWQSAMTGFYNYHEQFGIDGSEIVVNPGEDTTVDERDMFTSEEVQAMRDAVTNPRDRCILELLLNTGQRIRAIQTLRVKDVDTEQGVYYLNTDEPGLKGADKNGKKRPLLGAKRAVYDWLQDHDGNPDDYLITSLRSANRGTHGDKLSQSNIRRRLKKIADRAEIDKDPHPHLFRHHFVTICKRDYGMDDATIKHLIGHGQGSNIMETTYQHLSDEDHIESAEVAAGIKEEQEESSPLTPQVCPTCSTQLSQGARACEACGTVFSPDAKAAQDTMQESVKESYKQNDPEEAEQVTVVKQLDELVENPAVMDKLLENEEVMNKVAEKVADRMD
jgi:site-specific recombinase XerD